jgi:hypothetical protein
MARSVLLVLVLFLSLVPSRTLFAQAADPPPQNGWRATYWNNPSLAGFWRLQQIEENDLNYEWGFAAPAERVNEDYWSARWERTLRLQPGLYRFTVTVTNGVRVWVDNQLVIDEWGSQWMKSGGTFTGDVNLTNATHLLRVEYFNTFGHAALRVDWERYTGPPAEEDRWLASYYNNVDLDGAPAMIRREPEINLDTGRASPLLGTVNRDNFSVRWSRTLDLPAGLFEFSLRAAGGGRLQVAGNLLIDSWEDQLLTSSGESIRHTGGPLEVVMEYRKRSGPAMAQLSWEMIEEPPAVEAESEPEAAAEAAEPAPAPATESRPPTPDSLVIRHTGEGFVTGGPQQNWQEASGGYEGPYRWALNHQTSESNYVWGRWFPDVDPGRYEVWVYIPNDSAASRQARYWVVHSGNYVLRVVDQAANRGSWFSLGTFNFSGGDSEYISLADVTGEATGSVRVLWDAARWDRAE